MKRLVEAIDEFSAAQQDLLNDPPHQRNRRSVRHYQTYQRLQSAPLVVSLILPFIMHWTIRLRLSHHLRFSAWLEC